MYKISLQLNNRKVNDEWVKEEIKKEKNSWN